MEAFIQGAWRPDIRRAEAYIGGQWRRLTRAEAYIGGQWRQIAIFALPLTVSVPAVVGSRRSSTTISVIGTASATPPGGIAPYTYATVLLSGSMTVSSAATANPQFSKALAPEQEATATARLTCTDAVGTTATADFNVTLRNRGPLDIEEPL